MPSLRRFAILAARAALAGGALAACARPTPHPAPAAAPARELRFLLVNDVYVVDTLRDGSGGLARVAALRKQLAADGGGPVLFVLAGDVLSPSLLSKWYAGRQMVDAFDAAGLDYATLGNHELELDGDTLLDRVRRSRFRWVSANCTNADGTPFAGVPAWDTVTVGGTRVGIFGLTLRGDYRRYARCADPDSAAHAAIAQLRMAGAAVVVGLTHQDLAADSALLAREPALDLILGGHEHERHVVREGGRHVLKADANSRSAQLARLTRRAGGAGWEQSAHIYEIDRSLPFDSATAAVARGWRDSLLHRLGPERSVGVAPVRLDARDATSRRGESPLGDLVTDGMREGTGADVALINSGTLRLDDWLGPGPISNYQLESIFLFADETRVVTFPLTGARLRALLEHGVADGVYGHGGFLQLSGLRFRYDPSRPSGSRVVGDLVRDPGGRAIAPSDTVRVAFDVYPACTGGDGYEVPEAAPACAARGSAPRTVDLLLAHITGPLAGRIVAPGAGRITRLGAPPAASSR